MLLCSEDGTICTSTVFGCQRSHAADRSNRHDLKCERPGRASNKAAGHAHPSSCPPFRSTSAAAGWLTLVCGSEVRTAAASMRSCSEDHEVSLFTNGREYRWAAPRAPHGSAELTRWPQGRQRGRQARRQAFVCAFSPLFRGLVRMLYRAPLTQNSTGTSWPCYHVGTVALPKRCLLRKSG